MSTIAADSGTDISTYAKVFGDQSVKCAVTVDGDVELGFGQDLELLLSHRAAHRVHRALAAALDRLEQVDDAAEVVLVVDDEDEGVR